jgi:hypothetical protein
MKTGWGILFLLINVFGAASIAAPVLNENVADSGLITIYRDHVDANRFYIAPNVVKVAKNAKGQPEFSYTVYSTGFFSHNAILQIVLEPQYTQDDLVAVEKIMSAKNPQAQFSGVPVISAGVSFENIDKDLIEENGCNHAAGLVGQQIACTLHLSSKGNEVFTKLINAGQLVSTMSYIYRVNGMIQKPDKSYDPYIGEWGVAVVIDGAGLPHIN